ncbi:MAG: polynucleotide adenylyltransferase PcnB, partial [Acidiferrobacterales bacterium]
VGRRFRLAHVRFGREIIEVATFRGMPKAASAGPRQTVEGRILQDNVFGTQEEDAIRRDFTVNALYYDIRDNVVIDYVGGIDDLRHRLLRVIGDPEIRYREDPVRLLRVLRFAAKLDFDIEPATASPIRELGRLLLDVPPARMFEEIIKLFHSGRALKTYELLCQYRLFGYLFPLTQETLALEGNGSPRTLVSNALANTDSRVQEDKPVTPAFLFAALLWEPLRCQLDAHIARGHTRYEAVQMVTTSVLTQQSQRIAIPRRFSAVVREIWVLQSRFNRRTGKQPFRLLEHRRFRAAYDFLLLRIEIGEEPSELGDWWTRFQAVEESERRAMVRKLSAGKKRARRRQRS